MGTYDGRAQRYIWFNDPEDFRKGLSPQEGYSFLVCQCGSTRWVCVMATPEDADVKEPHYDSVPVAALLCNNCLQVIANLHKVQDN